MFINVKENESILDNCNSLLICNNRNTNNNLGDSYNLLYNNGDN